MQIRLPAKGWSAFSGDSRHPDMKKTSLLLVLIFLLAPIVLEAQSFDNLKGRIVLQVEDNGEAWYIHPDTLYRYYLGRPVDAFNVMRELGVGITNSDLQKIPIGIIENSNSDVDQDGLSDSLEKAIGTNWQNKDTDNDGFSDYEELLNNHNPLGEGVMPIDFSFFLKQKGKKFLQIESKGEAWYVDPTDNKRYYLGRPDDAFSLMRLKGLGISNNDLSEIRALTYNYNYTAIEEKLFHRINLQRVREGLTSLKWNNELALVARRHSENLKDENKSITGIGYSCDFPTIHHEGIVFGAHSHDRLNNHNIFYFGKSGENIALYSAASFKVRFEAGDPAQDLLDSCNEKRESLDDTFKAKLAEVETDPEIKNTIQAEIKKREQQIRAEKILDVSEINWYSEDYRDKEIVQGWMDSPGHRENIMESEFDETGMGVAYVNGYIIATQVFIKRADCGYFSGPCCEKKGYYPYCFVPLSCEADICG